MHPLGIFGIVFILCHCLCINAWAQHQGGGTLDSEGKNWGVIVRPHREWKTSIDGDSCFGVEKQTVDLSKKYYSYGPVGLWTCYYRKGGIKSRVMYDSAQMRKTIDWWQASGKWLVSNGLGYTTRLFSNYPGKSYDSITTQIVDSQENGYCETWLVSGQRDKYRSNYSFYGDGQELPVSISFFPDGRMWSLGSDKVPASMRFYKNGVIESFRYEEGNGKLSYCYDWHPNGRLKCCYRLANGHMAGAYRTYYPNGFLRQKGSYVQVPGNDTIVQEDPVTGKISYLLEKTDYFPVKDGIWMEYSNTGAIVRKEKYLKGVPVHE